MVARDATRQDETLASDSHELLPLPDEIDGKAVVRYFASDDAADTESGAEGIAEALALLGTWSDLDWDETVEALDRIRLQSKPAANRMRGES